MRPLTPTFNPSAIRGRSLPSRPGDFSTAAFPSGSLAGRYAGLVERGRRRRAPPARVLRPDYGHRLHGQTLRSAIHPAGGLEGADRSGVAPGQRPNVDLPRIVRSQPLQRVGLDGLVRRQSRDRAGGCQVVGDSSAQRRGVRDHRRAARRSLEFRAWEANANAAHPRAACRVAAAGRLAAPQRSRSATGHPQSASRDLDRPIGDRQGAWRRSIDRAVGGLGSEACVRRDRWRGTGHRR